jgi:hypothetical protein
VPMHTRTHLRFSSARACVCVCVGVGVTRRCFKVRHVFHHAQDAHAHLRTPRHATSAHAHVIRGSVVCVASACLACTETSTSMHAAASRARACRYRSTPRRASTSAISCGVLTTTAPDSGSF